MKTEEGTGKKMKSKGKREKVEKREWKSKEES